MRRYGHRSVARHGRSGVDAAEQASSISFMKAIENSQEADNYQFIVGHDSNALQRHLHIKCLL